MSPLLYHRRFHNSRTPSGAHSVNGLRVLIADETRRTGGVSEGIVTALVDSGFAGQIARVASEDSFIPLGAAAATVLLSEATIMAAARGLLR